MKQISFSLTTPQIRARTKDVTRRNGWLKAKAGDVVMAIEKGQGLKKGEKVVKLGQVRFTKVTRQRLSMMLNGEGGYGRLEVKREGFPDKTPEWFVRMYCQANDCTPDDEVTRIEFEYL